MGVKGLSGLISDVRELWHPVDLTNKRVVIDGNALFFYLYRASCIDQKCGGQYQDYFDIVTDFFDRLLNASVIPYVILDGCSNAVNKVNTIVNRRTSSIMQVHKITVNHSTRHLSDSVIPLFTRQVFIQSLKEKQIAFAVADCEGDKEAAALANHLSCPVLSLDSDFHIFELKECYVPLDTLNFEEAGRLYGYGFKAVNLAKYFQISLDLLPLLACLAGNDYISQGSLMIFYQELGRIEGKTPVIKKSKKSDLIRSIAYFLTEFRNREDAIEKISTKHTNQDKIAFELEICTAINEYLINEDDYNTFFKLILPKSRNEHHETCNPCLPMKEIWLERMRLGNLDPRVLEYLLHKISFLPVQAENIKRRSSNHCAKYLRETLCSVLVAVTKSAGTRAELPFTEYDRQGMSFRPTTELHLNEVIFTSLTSSNLQTLCTEDRLQILLMAFRLDNLKSDICSIPDNFRLFIMSVIFWLTDVEPKVKMIYLNALLIFVLGGTKKNDDFSSRRKKKEVDPFNIDALHSFAQWQTVLYFGNILNEILLLPISKPDICTLYNGTVIQRLIWRLESGQSERDFLSSTGMVLYRQLFDFIMSAVPTDVFIWKQKEDTIVKKKGEYAAKIIHCSTSNRFLALQEPDEEELQDD